jgi:CheY-like chemotaxis protein
VQAGTGESASPVPNTVLLVEDNPADLFVIRRVFERIRPDLQLSIARDGQEALRYLEQFRTGLSPCPVVILLDLNLPKVGGIEILKRLQSHPLCIRTPVIVITSSGADQAIVAEMGVNAYFQKPSRLAAYMELGQVIQKVLDDQ